MASARRRTFEILESARPSDRASHACDIALITLIAANVLAAMLESVPSIGSRPWLRAFEVFSVAVFTLEYGLRLWSCVERRGRRPLRSAARERLRYAVTPLALIDLLAILPAYLAFVVEIDLRFLRVLRILRILKLSHYFSALDILLEVVRIERRAFGAAFFLLTLGLLFASSGIYVFEHEEQPVAFGSIPASMWWAVATLTTVGYGDVTPVTVGGKIFGASITVLAVGMVALPTGILASGFYAELRRRQVQYGNELDRALEDGVIEPSERIQLELLRRQLGLSLEEVEAIVDERRGDRQLADRPRSFRPDKCPGCGERLDRA